MSASAIRTRLSTARKRLREIIATLSESAKLIESTVEGLDGWAEELRLQLGRGENES